jgi:hypothetical protein
MDRLEQLDRLEHSKRMKGMLTPAQTAYQFRALGVATIPIKPHDKHPDLAHWAGYQRQLPTPEQLLRWFDQPERNVGVVTGWRGLTVLDFDELKTYRKWLIWAQRQGRLSLAAHVASAAYRVSTSRGVHVYTWLLEPERNRHLPGGIDIKSRGGYVLGEGSIHPSGALYRALTAHMVIPHVAVLADILPAALLMQQEQPNHVAPLTLPPTYDDPWQAASNPAVVSTDLVARIKSTLRVESFFTQTERTSSDGRWLRCKCPLHDDGNPSFWLDTQRQICGCFAGCTNKPLDVIDLFARLYGLSNGDAIRELARRIEKG